MRSKVKVPKPAHGCKVFLRTTFGQLPGRYPVPRPLTLNLTLKMTLSIKTKVMFVFSVPNFKFKRDLREI